MRIKYRLRYLYRDMIIFFRRMRLRNHQFSIISNNCCGGVIYHDLGEKFLSPTINLFMRVEDYFRFLENFEDYMKAELYPISTDSTGQSAAYPIGRLEIRGGGYVDIHFVHYNTFEEAKEKWQNRSERIVRSNFFVLMELGVETTKEYVERFERLPFENKVCICNREFVGCPHSLFLDIYGSNYRWGKLVAYVPGTFKTKRYIELFDYIKWLNINEIRLSRHYQKLKER